MGNTVTFYHYTDTYSKDAIIASGIIYASRINAAFGKGVYGTTISPSEGRKKVSENNWDAGEDWQILESQGRADCAFKIKIPRQNLKQAISNRNILIHEDNICLADYEWELLEWPGDNCCHIL